MHLTDTDAKKIIYIASKGHSGSTLLDLLLSTHPRVCGLGEARMLVNDERRSTYTANAEERICSCGVSIDRCELWGRFIEYAEEERNAEFGEKYLHLLRMVKELMGEDVVLSDSSKYIEPLKKVTNLLQENGRQGEKMTLDDFLVVHLVKDARAWATSMKYRHDLDALRLAYYMFRWAKDNHEIDAFLNQKGIQCIQISYEELCFNPGSVLSSILNEAGLGVSSSVGRLEEARAHIGLGNPMRTDKNKSKTIIYDSRWFYEPVIQLLYYLVPGVKEYNEAVGSQSSVHRN